jgi:hypothetical protein
VGHIAIPPPPFPLTASFLDAEVRDARIYRSEHGGLLPDSEFWRYLEARWSLNPGRFDHWHPRIGPWLAEEYHLTHEPQTSTRPPFLVKPTDPPPIEIQPPVTPPPILKQPTDPPPIETPPTGGGDPPPPTTNRSGGATPEPSSWILLGTSVVAAFLVPKFRRG